MIDELWREQSVWSRTANRMKRRIDRARLAALATVVLVALCGTAAASLETRAEVASRVLAALAALGSALLPTLRPAWSGTALKEWTRARSVSEALKADVYLWLAGARPFTDDPDASRLRERTAALRRDAADLLTRRDGITAEQRGLPAVSDLPSYFTVRVQGQYSGYYTRKVAEIVTRLQWFRRAEVGLAATGAMLGAVAAVLGASVAAWVAVVATVGTAVSVHISAARYEFQRIEFSRTAEELRQIDSHAAAPGVSDRELLDLAERAERVISVENQGWMAKLAEDPPEQATNEGSATESS